MEENKKSVKYLLSTQNPYQINVENIIVTMEYTQTTKTFKECMINILRKKIGK